MLDKLLGMMLGDTVGGDRAADVIWRKSLYQPSRHGPGSISGLDTIADSHSCGREGDTSHITIYWTHLWVVAKHQRIHHAMSEVGGDGAGGK